MIPKIIHGAIPSDGFKGSRLSSSNRLYPAIKEGSRQSGTVTFKPIGNPTVPYRLLIDGVPQPSTTIDTTQWPDGSHVVAFQCTDETATGINNGSQVVVFNNSGQPHQSLEDQAVVHEWWHRQGSTVNSLAWARINVLPQQAYPLEATNEHIRTPETEAERKRLYDGWEDVWWVEGLTHQPTILWQTIPILMKNKDGDYFIKQWNPEGSGAGVQPAVAGPYVERGPAYDGHRGIGTFSPYGCLIPHPKVLRSGQTGFIGVEKSGRVCRVDLTGEVRTILGPRSVPGIVPTDSDEKSVDLDARLANGEKEYVGDANGKRLNIPHDIWPCSSFPFEGIIADTFNNRVVEIHFDEQRLMRSWPLPGVTSVYDSYACQQSRDINIIWFAVNPEGLWCQRHTIGQPGENSDSMSGGPAGDFTGHVTTLEKLADIKDAFWVRGDGEYKVYILTLDMGLYQYDALTGELAELHARGSIKQWFCFMAVDVTGTISPKGCIHLGAAVNTSGYGPSTRTHTAWFNPETKEEGQIHHNKAINKIIYGNMLPLYDPMGHYMWGCAIHPTLPKFLVTGITNSSWYLWTGYLDKKPKPHPKEAWTGEWIGKYRYGRRDKYIGMSVVFGHNGHGMIGYTADMWRDYQTWADARQPMREFLDLLFPPDMPEEDREQVAHQLFYQRSRKHFQDGIPIPVPDDKIVEPTPEPEPEPGKLVIQGPSAASLINIKIESSKWPDCASLESAIQSIFRIEGVIDAANEEKALALWRWFRILVSSTGGGYTKENGNTVTDGLKLLSIYGHGQCDNLSWALVSLWRAAGYVALDEVNMQHATASLHYKDHDGEYRYHSFDPQNRFVWWNQRDTVIGNRSVPVMTDMVHRHVMQPRISHTIKTSLIENETLERSWINKGHVIPAAGQEGYYYDYSEGKTTGTYAVSGTEIQTFVPDDLPIATSSINDTLEKTYKISSSYPAVSATLSLDFDKPTLDNVCKVYFSRDNVNWKLIYDAIEIGNQNVELEIDKQDIYTTYDFYLKFELKPSASLKSLNCTVYRMLNKRTLPNLMPGENVFKITADSIEAGKHLELTFDYSVNGEAFTKQQYISNLPHYLVIDTGDAQSEISDNYDQAFGLGGIQMGAITMRIVDQVGSASDSIDPVHAEDKLNMAYPHPAGALQVKKQNMTKLPVDLSQVNGFLPQANPVAEVTENREEYVKQLIASLGPNEWDLVAELGNYPETLDQLIGWISNSTNDMRVFVLKALAQIADPKAIPALLEEWKNAPHGAPGTRYIPDVLAAIGDQSVVPALIGKLSGARFDFRFHIAHALKILGGVEAEAALLDMAQNDPLRAIREYAAVIKREPEPGLILGGTPPYTITIVDSSGKSITFEQK